MISRERRTPIYEQNNSENAYNSLLQLLFMQDNSCFPYRNHQNPTNGKKIGAQLTSPNSVE